jgi:hypothetical protein
MWQMKMCFDKRILLGFGLVTVGLLIVAPGMLGAALPVMLMAACPLSMLVMMRGMGGGHAQASRADSYIEARDAELVRLRGEIELLKREQAHSEGLPTGR